MRSLPGLVAILTVATTTTVSATYVPITSGHGISVEVAGPHVVTDVSDLKVIVIVQNTGSETLTLLEDRRSPLRSTTATASSDVFKIINDKGVSPEFIGAGTTYDYEFVPVHAAELGGVITLAPGESKTVEHELSNAYGFATSGDGVYHVEANNLFHIVKDDKLEPIYAATKAHTIDVSRLSPPIHQLGTYVGCSRAFIEALEDAEYKAIRWIDNAAQYLDRFANAGAQATRYQTWFGQYDLLQYNLVKRNFAHMSGGMEGESLDDVEFHCESNRPECLQAPDATAFTYPQEWPIIHICPPFLDRPDVGVNTKAGTLIHEFTHFVQTARTDDVPGGYGQAGAMALARNNPGQAVHNADNYKYFAEGLNNPNSPAGFTPSIDFDFAHVDEQDVVNGGATTLWVRLTGGIFNVFRAPF